MEALYIFLLQRFQALAHALQGGHLCALTGHRAPQVHYSGGATGQAIPLLPEGKTFCQHCGEGIVLQWVELRCSGCERPRFSRTLWGQIHPHEKACMHCGASETRLRVLERPQVYQLHHAVLRVLTVTQYLAQPVEPLLQSGVAAVWIERVLLSPKACPHLDN